MKNNLFSYLLLLSVTILSGCDDFLKVESDSQKMTSNSFKTYDDLRSATAYLYCQPWIGFNATSGAMTVLEGRANNLVGDGYSGSLAQMCTFTESGALKEIGNVWQSLYNVVTQSDYVINDYAPITKTYIDTTLVNACVGEARFMRGTAYWYLAMLWHDVPIIDKPQLLTRNYQITPNVFEDVLQYAINDLKYATQTLPVTDDAGRVTKYSANGMLSRLYLTAADYALGNNFSSDYLKRNPINGNVPTNSELAEWYFAQVSSLTNEIIKNGTQYGLMQDYEELFRIQNNNNKESLFSLQFIPGSSTLGNSNGSLAYSSLLTNNLPAYSVSTFASFDVVHLSHLDKGKSRARANFFMYGEKYSYLSYLSTEGFAKTKCNIKKQVVGSALDTDGKAISGNSGLMTPMLRYADVLLMNVEAKMGKNSSCIDENGYFDQVRSRAFYYYDKNGLANPYVKSTEVTRDMLFKERRLEFFMEYLFWPDIVKRSFYDMDWVKKYLNNTLNNSSAYKTGSNGLYPKTTTVYYVDTAYYKLRDLNTQFTNFSWMTYTYNPTVAANEIRAGFDATMASSTSSPRLDGQFYLWGAAIHNLPTPYPNNDNVFVHQSGSDNIWSLPYPDEEATYNPKLLDKPVKYNF